MLGSAILQEEMSFERVNGRYIILSSMLESNGVEWQRISWETYFDKWMRDLEEVIFELKPGRWDDVSYLMEIRDFSRGRKQKEKH